MVYWTGKRRQNTTMCHDMTVRGVWVMGDGFLSHSLHRRRRLPAARVVDSETERPASWPRRCLVEANSRATLHSRSCEEQRT